MWDMITNGHPTKVKMVDEAWLQTFQNGEVDPRLGDALLSQVRIDLCRDLYWRDKA